MNIKSRIFTIRTTLTPHEKTKDVNGCEFGKNGRRGHARR